MTDLVEVTCPRCATTNRQRFYGPCPVCHDELRQTYRGAARLVVVPDYEPKMNVTPNAVALKDD